MSKLGRQAFSSAVVFFFLLGVRAMSVAAAEYPQTKDECREVADEIVQAIATPRKEERDDALHRVLTKRLAHESEARVRFAVAEVVKSSGDYIEDYGPPTVEPVEFVGQVSLGEQSIWYVYWVKHRLGPVPWVLWFRRTAAGWPLIGIHARSVPPAIRAATTKPFPANRNQPVTDSETNGQASPRVAQTAWPAQIRDDQACEDVARRLMDGVMRGKTEQTLYAMFKHFEHDMRPEGDRIGLEMLQRAARRMATDIDVKALATKDAASGTVEYLGRVEVGKCMAVHCFFLHVDDLLRPCCVLFYRAGTHWTPVNVLVAQDAYAYTHRLMVFEQP